MGDKRFLHKLNYKLFKCIAKYQEDLLDIRHDEHLSIYSRFVGMVI